MKSKKINRSVHGYLSWTFYSCTTHGTICFFWMKFPFGDWQPGGSRARYKGFSAPATKQYHMTINCVLKDQMWYKIYSSIYYCSPSSMVRGPVWLLISVLTYPGQHWKIHYSVNYDRKMHIHALQPVVYYLSLQNLDRHFWTK